MKKNYLVYPFKTMNITQNYNGKTSHLPYGKGTPKDYPIDEAGADLGRDYMYCPCDEMVIKRIYGVGTGGTNSVWLESTKKVVFADSTSNYCTVMAIHPNDDDLKVLKVGQTFKRGEKMFREGTDGHASGNHVHFSAGKGKMKGIGWEYSSTSKWVLTTASGTDKPENLFYVDKSFTTVKNSGQLKFKELPEEKPKNTEGAYIVNTALLYVRKGPDKSYAKVKYDEMTASAKEQILRLSGKKRDGYVKGTEFNALEIKNGWARTPSGWVSLEYCKKK